MAEHGIKIDEKNGVFHLSGVLNEYADFSMLLQQKAPLSLNMRRVSRLNSIGIRNLLKFLADWGDKAFAYEECPSEFIDQINMIPALLGVSSHGKITTLFVPYECGSCENEDEVLSKVESFVAVAGGNRQAPTRTCGKCGGTMSVLSDTFFVFLNR